MSRRSTHWCRRSGQSSCGPRGMQGLQSVFEVGRHILSELVACCSKPIELLETTRRLLFLDEGSHMPFDAAFNSRGKCLAFGNVCLTLNVTLDVKPHSVKNDLREKTLNEPFDPFPAEKGLK